MLGQRKSSQVSEITKFKGESAGNVVTSGCNITSVTAVMIFKYNIENCDDKYIR